MNKNFSITVFVSVFLLSFNACSGQGAKPAKKETQKHEVEKLLLTPDSVVVNFWGELKSKVIFNPKEVILYTLEGIKKPDTSSVMLSKYVVKKKYGAISPEVFLPFQLHLSDSSFYKIDDMHNKCVFIPDVAFECKSDKESVLILLSLPCEQIGIEYKGHLKFEEYNHREIVLKYLKSIAGDDEFIKSFYYSNK